MYIEITNCPTDSAYMSIQIQSKLRFGQSDFGVNPRRVSRMYECIYNKTTEGILNSYLSREIGLCKF